MSSIITTKRNNTAIAPTYTTIKTKGKKSRPKIKSKRLPLTNKSTRHKTEMTGFLFVISKDDARMQMQENKKNSFIIYQRRDLNPYSNELEPKPSVSTNFTTLAFKISGK